MDSKTKHIVREYIEIDNQITEIGVRVKGLKERKLTLEDRLLEIFASEGIERLTMEGRTFYPRNEVGVSVTDRENAEEVLRSFGLDHCVGVVNASLKSAIREMMGEEREIERIPQELQDVLRVYKFQKLGNRRS